MSLLRVRREEMRREGRGKKGEGAGRKEGRDEGREREVRIGGNDSGKVGR